MNSAPMTPPGWTRLAYALVAVAFVDNLALVPVLAPHVRDLGGGSGWAGLVLAGYSTTNLLGNMLAGYVLDRVGRRLPVLAGLFGTALVLWFYTLARTPAVLLAVRLLHGAVVSQLNPAAVATLGDLSRPGDQAYHAGRTGAVIGVTAFLAPPLGGLAARSFGIETLFLLLAGVMALAGICALFAYPETLQKPSAAMASWTHPWGLFRDPALRRAYAATLGFTLALGLLTVQVPLRVRAGGSGMHVGGLLFGWFALLAVAVMVRIRRARETSDPALIGTLWRGLVLVAAAMAVLPVGGFGGLAAGMTLYGLGFGLCFPSSTALVQHRAPAGFRGTAIGLLFGIYSGGVILGQLAAGFGYHRPYAVPWAVAGFLGMLGLGIGYMARMARTGRSHHATAGLELDR